MQTVTLARHAMATRFEIILHGHDALALRAAGEEALNEICRLESQLSLYRPGSEIAQVNARAANEPVQVSPEVFALLQHARTLWQETGGAFDITIAPLVRCWGFMGASGRLPAPDELAAALATVGMQHVSLDATRRTVRFSKPGVMLDLGAIGKGYAVEQSAGILRDAGVTSALIHGGTSTVHALGHPPDAEFWKIAIEQTPADRGSIPCSSNDEMKREILLRDEALSVSAVWGRTFEAEQKHFGHVIDPRTGQPTETALLAAVVLPGATETDALSTALLTLGVTENDAIAGLRTQMRTVLMWEERGALRCQTRGFSAQP